MKREFTQDQLEGLETLVDEALMQGISDGNLMLSHEAFDILNTIKSQQGKSEYKGYTDYLRIVIEPHDDITFRTVDAMAEWATSEIVEPTFQLKKAIKDYLHGTGFYPRKSEYDTIEYRSIPVNILVFLCENKCTKGEMARLLYAVKDIVADL